MKMEAKVKMRVTPITELEKMDVFIRQSEAQLKWCGNENYIVKNQIEMHHQLLIEQREAQRPFPLNLYKQH